MKSRLPNLFTLFVLLASLVGSAVFTTPVYAASLVVNSNADTVVNDGVCTLREAITAANTDTASGAAAGECAAGSGADTITFAANYTFTLVGSQLPSVTTQITINGNGTANTVVQANAAANTATYRVFQVSNTGNLTLNSLTARHGRCNGACIFGGGISNLGTLIVTNSTLSGNTTSNSPGGGIYNSGILMVTNSTLSGNTTSNNPGGGIYNSGTLTVTESTLSGNTTSSGNGGGIYNSGTLTVTNSTLSGNTVSGGNGGGIYNSNGNPSLNKVTISNNTATNGGGLYNASGNPILSMVTIDNNTADFDGGGIYNIGGDPTLTNVTINNNTADADGGGIYNDSGDTALTAVTISNNTADQYGGGIYNDFGKPVLTNVTVSANSANDGGALYAIGFGSTLTNVTVSNNTAVTGGAFFFNNVQMITLFNTIIADNTAPQCSGVLSAITTFHNLVDDTNCGMTNNDAGENIVGFDPNLGPLANNGGLTQTHALLLGSLAIDAGEDTYCPAIDQRGMARPFGASCDIGAFEYAYFYLYLPLIKR